MRIFPALVLAHLLVASAATAQVGHSPDNSPYADILTNRSLNFQFSTLGGNGGSVGVGPRNGRLFSSTFNIRMGTPTEVFFSLGVGKFDRTIINPNNGPTNLVVADTTKNMTFLGVGFNWLLTGKKTWHRLAPYFGTGVGFTLGGTIASDPGAFGFQGKFFATPRIGVRWHVTNRFLLRFEATDTIWKLTYPPLYFLEPINAPGAAAVLDGTFDTQWTHQATFTIGFGYAFRY